MGTAMITMFAAFLLHRFLSGVRNGMLYTPKPAAPFAPHIVSGAMLLLLICLVAIQAHTGFSGFFHYDIVAVAIGVCYSLSVVSSYMALRSMTGATGWGRLETDLHLWTLLEQSFLAVPLALSGWGGLLAMCCAVYPAVFIQKVTINRFLNLDWDYNGTDDPEGKYYGIPSLGIRVPRTTQVFRAWLTVASLAALILGKIFFS